MQFICYFFLISDETQCKNNSRGTSNKLSSCVHMAFLYRSPCVHFSLCASVCVPFALCVRSPFTVHKRSQNFVQRALTVRLECAHHSLTVQVGK